MWSRVVMSQMKHNSYFITGMVVGLWVSVALIPLDEEAGCPAEPAAAAAPDDYEPQREARPLGVAAQPPRALQRPRYYTTELGMRGSVLTGVLSSEERLESFAAAINDTAARLQPALKFFIAASGGAARPPRPNVVGFTDTREMLKPFHALKYLADNYLEEYDFFFLVTDAGYVDARRLRELAAGLSVSRDVYLGEPDGDSQYCSLDAGVLLSNSVLRAVHAELDWCVRNSYSPRHHENVGRCVLHAAHAPCTPRAQARAFRALTAPAAAPADLYRRHARTARERARRAARNARRLRAELRRTAVRHPPHYRNASWPAGLRDEPGLAPAPPDSRFDHLRWTAFNATHALMPDELRAAAPLAGAWAAALADVRRQAAAWAARSGLGAAHVLEGAWQWAPPSALRYRLLVRSADGPLRLLEGARALGAARLAPVRYVTESARVTLVLVVAEGEAEAAAACLRRVAALCARPQPDCNLAVLVGEATAAGAADSATLRAAAAPLGARVLRLPPPEPRDDPARASFERLLPALPADQPLLLAGPEFEFDRDFLNRVRMNTIRGEQWFQPVPYARFASAAAGAKAGGAGRFMGGGVVGVYRGDYEAAAAAGGGAGGVADVLARAALRCVRAPEPGVALRAPRAPPPAPRAPPLSPRAPLLSPRAPLALGGRAALAQLLLEAADAA